MKVANRNTARFGLLRGVWADLLRWMQGPNYNDSDCCGGLEAVGRLLALDSRCFQKLRQIPTKSVFLALDSRSFLKLRWIPTKKSVCAGFQYCCAGLRFSLGLTPNGPQTLPRGFTLPSFRDQTSGHRETEAAHPLVTGDALPCNPILIRHGLRGLGFRV